MYVDNSGNEFVSYADACRYYGADTPEQIAAEEAAYAAEEHEEWCLLHGMWMEMSDYRPAPVTIDDEIPF